MRWLAFFLVILNVIIWEGVYLDHRWQATEKDGEFAARHAASLQNAARRDLTSDVVCPEPKAATGKCQCNQAQLEVDLRAAKERVEKAEEVAGRQNQELISLRAIAAAKKGNFVLANPEIVESAVLIATPMKNWQDGVQAYFDRLSTITYPRAQTSLAILVSDSLDETLRLCRTAAGQLPGQSYRRATVLQRDFGYQQAPDPKAVPKAEDEVVRRAVLARSRNWLLSRTLRDEGWVLWLDVDIIKFPPTIIQDLMASKADVAVAGCQYVDDSGSPTGVTCDEGSWAETEASRAYLSRLDPQKPLFENFGGDVSFRGTRQRLLSAANKGKDTVKLDAVGAQALLVRAELHRDGLTFPTVLVDHQIEAEALGKMAVAAGHSVIGLPSLMVDHAAIHKKEQPQWD